jgi:site-specific DNA-methyltransferase (adenine-specific)
MIQIIECDNLEWLRAQPNGFVNLIYIDPPFNTGKKQKRKRSKTVGWDNGKRVIEIDSSASSLYYDDLFDDFISFIEPRLKEAHRILKSNGSFFFHIDYREVHYAKIAIDKIFGRENFINEIIWSYDYGAKPKNRWPAKHDNILWYAKNKNDYTFNYSEIDRIPYMALGMVKDKAKAEQGKIPTDVWWSTIVSPIGKEKTSYPTQKPLKILTRIVKVHSNENDLLLDFFAGSGSFGEAAMNNNRNCILIDNNTPAIKIMEKRLQISRTIWP